MPFPLLAGKEKIMELDIRDERAATQASLWNGPSGRAWVDTQALLDRLFRPFEERLVEAALEVSATAVLDVGCGTGATTLAIARQLGPRSRCQGIDISLPMIAAARGRAEEEGAAADFVCADAQRHTFEPSAFDTLVSRFGLMFFDDPVAAFRNLRSAVRDGAELRFYAWRGAAANPFMTVAERAAGPLLLGVPPRRPGAPGQFAFADRHRIHRLLEESGWGVIDIEPRDVECTMAEAELETYFTRLGPVGLALAQCDAATRLRMVAEIRPAFDPFVRGDEVRFTAACWAVGARAIRP
jgi:SAM-dependent methyltransferase